MPKKKTGVMPLAKINPKYTQITNRIKTIATKDRNQAPMGTDMIENSDFHSC